MNIEIISLEDSLYLIVQVVIIIVNPVENTRCYRKPIEELLSRCKWPSLLCLVNLNNIGNIIIINPNIRKLPIDYSGDISYS